MVDQNEQLAEKLLASLPDDILDRLANLIALKLMAKNGALMPSKQVVAGSNPVSRSKPILNTCLTPASLDVQLARYHLDTRAQGYSEATITDTESCVRSFALFCGGITDVTSVGGDDVMRKGIYCQICD